MSIGVQQGGTMKVPCSVIKRLKVDSTEIYIFRGGSVACTGGANPKCVPQKTIQFSRL
jgi:TATA-box binding protein (TBP) (component of TFIID and TFIIIB)